MRSALTLNSYAQYFFHKLIKYLLYIYAMVVTKYNTPFPHYVFTNFLASKKYSSLKRAVLNLKYTRFDSDLFSFYQSKNLLISKNKHIMQFCNTLLSQDLEVLFNKKLNGVVDVSAFIYKQSDYLLPHDDLITEADKKRKLAYIFYFSTLKKSQGGSLDLFSKNKVVKSMSPKENTLIVFDVSRHSFHQVSEVFKGKRVSLAGWFYG